MMKDGDAGQSHGTIPNRKIGMKHPTRKKSRINPSHPTRFNPDLTAQAYTTDSTVSARSENGIWDDSKPAMNRR